MANAISLVKNPLTIIAMFAGLAEVSGTAILPWIAEPNQKIYIYFLMFFPTFLVSLFFFTLHKKSESLYAPSDFADERNYMTLIGQKGISITSPLSKDDALNISVLEGGITTETNDVADEAENNGHESESTNQDDKYLSVDTILPSFKRRPLKSAPEPADKNEKTRKKLGSELSHMAFKYAESKLGVNFDVDKGGMKNDLGYHNFDGAYFPPISNGSLTGDIVFLEVKVLSSMRINNFINTIDLINETWRHFKNFRVYLVYVFTEKNNSGVSSFMKEISIIKNKAHFPLEIDTITADELTYKFGSEKNANQ
ncbi:hypothetical protein [Phytobacter diazotrophicus]|uniref:hypothetical protein n=1 Tax=Phytobacter diazotrophicus TaxID=395631 RepID=UPI002FF76EDB